MTTLPAADLSTPLLTDVGLTDAAFAATIYAALGRLNGLARTAGLQLNPGFPDEEGTSVSLGDADETTVVRLAGLLSTAPAPAPPASGNPPEAVDGMDGAARTLLTAARAAGVELTPGAPRTGDDGRNWLPLGHIGHAGAMRLADVIEHHLAGLFEAEQALRAALSTAGVTAGRLSADIGAVDLGDITIPGAVALLRRLLPAGRVPDVPDTDPDDPPAGEALAGHIARAVTAVTGRPFDASYTHPCHWCSHGPAIVLGRLQPADAQALAARLTTV
ncbi:hypothetical protein [Actinacidiphila sp. ITFR-21]|uniref:hypothetical protein n=1 Tax=Actinacidiphila sp. ITFR-21 TaxID=3075199 RepID=UPI0028898481|nr:hypothetical protein [Streptomyces sp. ITFR-21]WNI19968.1 hypothetical protein RLT57_30980 [Streptomyces sp. ITFR-21]